MRVRQVLLLLSVVVPSGAAAQAATRPDDLSYPLVSRRHVAAAGLLLAAAFMSDEGVRFEAQESRSVGGAAVARVGNAFGEPRVVLPALGATYLAGELVATAIADETPDPWSDVALYGAATLTAFARVAGDRHWTSDVLAGALVGHLSARWLYRRHGRVTVRRGGVGISFSF